MFLRFRCCEIVRLKALDPYFENSKNIFTLPHPRLIYATVEDRPKYLKIAILSSCWAYFELHPKLSFLNDSRNQRGLRQDEKFFIFLKVWIKTFQTHHLPCILPKWVLRYPYLKFFALGVFSHKKPPARSKTEASFK